MNTPFRRKKNEEAQKEAKKRCLRVHLLSARALFDEDFDLGKERTKKKGVEKTCPSSLFLVCLAHFFFCFCICLFFISFSFTMKSFSLATMKNVLLWGKGLRRRGRTTKGHREEEEEEGNDNNNDNNNKGCVGTRVIATREIRFLFFRRRTVRRRSRYAPSFFLSLSLCGKKRTDSYITKSLLSVKRKTEKTRREKSPN
jgi:hypothetical protein